MIEKETIGDMDRTKIPLNRVLGVGSGILLVAGIMIGSGVFKKIAPMAQTGLDEFYILLAWIIAGLITMFGAFTYAGLASMTTATGGVYEYLRLVYGDFVAFLFGWMLFMIGGSGSIAALAFVFSQSADTFLHFPDPLHAWREISLGGIIFPFAGSGIKIFAVLTILVLTWVNYRGVKKGSTLNNIVTAAKILGIVFLILLGLFFAGPKLAETTTETTPLAGTALFSAMFGAMLSALWAYDGWANITYVTGEIKNPQRNIPIAIVSGLGIAMALYVMLNLSFMKVLPLSQLAAVGENKIAAAEVAGSILGNAGTVIIAVLIMVSTFGAVNACIITYPRVYYKMSKENVFFKKVANVHPLFKTPYVSLIYSCIWSCILVVSGTFDLLTNLVIFSGYLFFGLVAWGLVRMKRRGMVTAKVTAYPFAPIIIILFSLTLVINTLVVQTKQSLIGIALVLSGVPFYFYFKKKSVNR
ncbi:MAG TPA: amino acid permease [Puia sp.]|nr:amino acid permease [Puia sp.]